MPARALDFRTVTANSGETFVMDCGLQIIKSVSFSVNSAIAEPTLNYAEVWVSSGSSEPAARIATLANGYVSFLHAISWVGSLPTEPTSFIGVSIWGLANVRFRLSASLWKIITADDGGFRVDP